MLVKRLNDSITRALEKVQEMAQRGPSCLIDDETDAAARKIETAEQASRQEWIENHSVPDEDGRARCSFHFCHKLFQDRAFLHKHLLKKHSDQLRADCAKFENMVVAPPPKKKKKKNSLLCGSILLAIKLSFNHTQLPLS